MINLEQVKLLEEKVAKLVDYLERLTKENTALRQQESESQAKVETYKKRIDELEVLVTDFKEDQGQIEEGILAALDRLNQFEQAIEKSLQDKPADAGFAEGKGKAVKEPAPKEPAALHPAKPAAKEPTAKEPATKETAPSGAATNGPAATAPKAVPAQAAADSGDGQTCFEIPEGMDADVPDPLEDALIIEAAPAENRELDIF